jgi:hypothetical protein
MDRELVLEARDAPCEIRDGVFETRHARPIARNPGTG